VAVVVGDPLSVRPYAQLLNTSAWMLQAADLDPATLHPELLAYLLAAGDWMALTSEVSGTAVRTGLWWPERTDAECTAFAAARWWLLVRYLFEYQCLQPTLGMTAIADPLAFFATSTGFDQDFFAPGILDERRFVELAAAVGRLCTSYAVDATRLCLA
jgi:hypothetical protein